MTITTKYNIGDKVWMAFFDTPKEVVITGIKYTLLGISLICKYYNKHTGYESEVEIPEELLYPTKEELLKSLQYENNKI